MEKIIAHQFHQQYEFGVWTQDVIELQRIAAKEAKNKTGIEKPIPQDEQQHINASQTSSNEADKTLLKAIESANATQTSSDNTDEVQLNTENVFGVYMSSEKSSQRKQLKRKNSFNGDDSKKSKTIATDNSQYHHQITNTPKTSFEQTDEMQSNAIKSANEVNLVYPTKNTTQGILRGNHFNGEKSKTIGASNPQNQQQHNNTTQTITNLHEKNADIDPLDVVEANISGDDAVKAVKPKVPIWWRLNNYYSVKEPKKTSITAVLNQSITQKGTQIKKNRRSKNRTIKRWSCKQH